MTDTVGEITGKFGVWQLRAILIIFLCKIPSSWFMACVIFTAPEPRDGEVQCKQYEYEEIIQNQSNIGLVQISNTVLNDNENNFTKKNDYCIRYENRKDTTQNDSSDLLNGHQCQQFEHKSNFYSLVMQFDLICSREILVAWTQFWHLFGVLVGGIIATILMNYISPRRVMLIGILSQIVCGCITGLIDNFNSHCLFRCFSAICCAQMFTAGQVIFLDITGGKYRIAIATLFDQFWSIGVILLPGFSSFFKSWVHIYLGISLPSIILIFLYQWIPDAPRWLLKRDRIEEAETILIESAEINERNFMIPHNLRYELQLQANTLKSEQPPAEWMDLWKGHKAKTHFICAHIALAVYIVNFNGMLLNIRSFGREYLAMNTIITGFSEIIGCFLALHFTLKSKNKWICAGIYNIVAGLIGCLGWIFPESLNEFTRVILWIIISSIPKAGVSISQSMLLAGMGELVAIEKRQIFSFSCIVWARIWLLTAPFINVLKYYDVALSLSAFSILGLIGGIATCFMKSLDEKHTRLNERSNNTSAWTISTDQIERTKL